VQDFRSSIGGLRGSVGIEEPTPLSELALVERNADLQDDKDALASRDEGQSALCPDRRWQTLDRLELPLNLNHERHERPAVSTAAPVRARSNMILLYDPGRTAESRDGQTYDGTVYPPVPNGGRDNGDDTQE
jgi:hypothetical protein